MTPFEPSLSPSTRLPWSVAALLLATGDALASRFGALSVRGEISGFNRAASGHCYFALKDADGAPALLRCAMFRRAAGLVDFAPADGQQVELRGRLGVYEARGELQMIVESLQRVGSGALYEEFLRRRARLQAEGLFDGGRKRTPAAYPHALGVVTSLAAAALRDVLITLERRAPQVRVVVYPAAVQGAEAPLALQAALRLAAARAEVDTLLLVRGGGSLEDLWAFNDERVVRAVATSPMPVVCGVGHESDVTLADLAADLRAPTPTAAAELAAPARVDCLAELEARRLALQRVVERRLTSQAQQLDGLTLRLGQPARGLIGQGQKVDALTQRLQRALRQASQQSRHAAGQLAARLLRAGATELRRHGWLLESTQQRLRAQDPHRVLQRGYAWVQAADGRPVVSVRDLRQGQAVRAVWADGSAQAEVLKVEPMAPTA